MRAMSILGSNTGFQYTRVRYPGTPYGLSAEAERRNVFDPLGIEPGSVSDTLVLDAGCGDGSLPTVLAQQFAQMVGIDISASARLAAKRCRDFSNVTVLEADLFSPPSCRNPLTMSGARVCSCTRMTPGRASRSSRTS